MRSSIFIALLTAFFLAACGTADTSVESVLVTVTNPADEAHRRVVELDAEQLETLGDNLSGTRVLDGETGEEVASQVVEIDGRTSLLFLADVNAGASRTFTIESVESSADFDPLVYAMHHERRDDIAWENDRVAFRTYGEGLWTLEDLVSSGIDVFTKRTDALVLDRWYESGDYHTDHGEGADFFSVGQTLGGGGTAAYVDGELHPAPNFHSQQVLANGPLRAVVEMEYGPWDAGDSSVQERRRITIDAGQDFYRQETWITGDVEGMNVAAGLVTRSGVQTVSQQDDDGTAVLMWGPVGNQGTGELGTAIVSPAGQSVSIDEDDNHHFLHGSVPVDAPFIHYVGSCWTDAGWCDDLEAWEEMVREFRAELDSPVFSVEIR